MPARRIAIGLVGAAAVIAVAAAACDLVARGWAVQQVEMALNQPPFTKASHGAVTYSLLSRRISIDALAAETSLPEVPALSAAQVEINGIGVLDLGYPGRDGLSLSGVTARQLDLAVPGGHESFSVLTIRGLECRSLPSAAAAKLFAVSAQRVDGQDFRSRDDATSHDTRIASFTIESLEMTPVRGGGTQALIDAPPPTLAIARLAAAKLSVAVDGSSTAADRVELAGLSLSPGAGAIPAHGASLATWRRYLSHAMVERVDVAQVAMALANGDRLHVDRLHTGGVAAGRLDALELDNLVAEGNAGRFRVGAFALENLAYDLGELPLKAPRIFLGRLRFADLAGGLKPDAQIAVQELVLTMDGNLEKRTGAALKVSGIQLSAAAAPMLRLIDYDKLSLEISGRSTYEEKDGVVESRSLVAAPEAGRLGLAMRLSNYPAMAPAPTASDLLRHLREARLDRFELRYEDASLADHLLKLYGSFSGRDVGAMRAELIAQIAARRDAYPGNANLQQGLEKIIAFLRHPGAVTVRLMPPKPLRFEELSVIFAQGDLSAAADRLGLSIE